MRMWDEICLFDLFVVIDKWTKWVVETKLIHNPALFDTNAFIIPNPGVGVRTRSDHIATLYTRLFMDWLAVPSLLDDDGINGDIGNAYPWSHDSIIVMCRWPPYVFSPSLGSW